MFAHAGIEPLIISYTRRSGAGVFPQHRCFARLAAAGLLGTIAALFAACDRAYTDLEPNDAALLGNLTIAAKAAETSWPGYKPFSAPLMFVRSGTSAVLIEHPHPPSDFNRARFSGLKVFISRQPPEIGSLFLRKYILNKVPITVIRYDDKQTPSVNIAVAIHEHFHDYQDSWRVISYDQNYGTKDAEDVAMATIEQECLAGTLESRRQSDLDCFLALRISRYGRFPVATLERDQERREGTARFVDYESRAAAYGLQEGLPDLIAHLRQPATVDQMGHSRSYFTGAALCYILAREAHGTWEKEIEGGQGPYDLVAKLHPMTDADARRITTSLMQSPRYTKALDAARRGLAAWQRRRRDAIARFMKTPGTHVRLMTGRMTNSGKLDTYYSSSGEEFEVEVGKKLLENADSYQSKAPGWDCDVRNRTVLFGEDAEFVVSSTAAMKLNGKAWRPVKNTTKFQTFELSEPGAVLRISDGNVKFDGKLLELYQ
jgi:hypothetical protein